MSTLAAGRKADHDTYKGPRHDGEYERLRIQHGMVKANMNGRLVLATVDLQDPHLSVLDSAAGDGYWLTDLAQGTAPTSTLIGADIAEQHFADYLLPNVRLIVQNIFDPWPQEYVDRFDLVHQRFVLPVCNDQKSMEAIKHLLECVKPGGYIQLHDGDMETIEEGATHKAMVEFRDVMVNSWKLIGHNLSPGPKLAGWLSQLGAEDVKEHVVTHKCGAAAHDPEVGEKAVQVLLALLDGVKILLGGQPDFFFTPHDFDRLRAELEEELWTVGNSYNTYVVVARKPASTTS